MLVTTQAEMVSVKVALVEMLEYYVKVSKTVTVWVPIVAALLVETESSPAEFIVTSAADNAAWLEVRTLLTENVNPPHRPVDKSDALTVSIA